MGDKSYKFQKLTPFSDVELGVYKNAIDFVFDNDDLKNIAISGQYSAGKSSLVESYKKNHPKIKFVHISLAHFRVAKQAGTSGSEEPVSETVLEGKILNQLIHQINSDDIPQTNFKVKKKVTSSSVTKTSFFIVLFVAMILHIALSDKWYDFVSSLSDGWLKTLLILTTENETLLVSGAICAVLFCILVHSLIRMQKTRNMLRKISLQGNEIDIFEESEDSYFDRYLNEVLYLFENIEADAIVFEDMDRFNSNNIFERLHEVNRLVNIQRGLSGNQKPILRFIYLLRDDIFISKDRTKFFDYIIPVIPVVDSSNSYDQFISIFKAGDILSLFNERFLQGLSLYIDDMRILKNIYNEFVVYYNRLNIIELDCDKMLAIIAYKNIFPRDFSDLQINQGMVFGLFNEKENIINKEVKRLEADINYREQEVRAINNEILNSIEEVNAIYDKELSKYSNHPYSHQNEKQDVENKRQLRKENVENKINGRIEVVSQELSKLKSDLVDFRNKSLKEIIKRENIDAIFKVTYTNEIGEERYFNEIKSSEHFDLLKYLIRGGYIDETYADYMTYFYENSLSRSDKMFLRSITDQKGKEFTYQLSNPKLIVSRLREVDFKQQEILNFDLLAYLLQSPVHVNLIERLFTQLREDNKIDFIHDYFETERAQPGFINKLNVLWPDFIYCAIEESKLSADWVRRYSIGTFYYSSTDAIEHINIDDCFTKYVSGSENYLSIAEPKVNKLISGFKLLNVSFVSINFELANKKLFNEVYEHSLYSINIANLDLMLRTVYQHNNKEDICHKNYTLVMSQPDSPLAKYVNSHIADYIDTVLSGCDSLITDDENIVLSILNNESVSDEQKDMYIDSLKTSVTSLSDIENESLWVSLLDRNIAICSEENIISYFLKYYGLDSSLVGFINRSDVVINFERISIEKEDKIKLFKSIVICEELSNGKYEDLLCSLHLIYGDSFGVVDIADDKFKILVDAKIIRMNLDSLDFIRENYPEQLLYYINNNIEIYIDVITKENVILDEVMSILSSNIQDDMKIKLISVVKVPLSIAGKGYSTIVNDYILTNNFELDELLKLTSSYQNWDGSTQSSILSKAMLNISTLIANPDDVSESLVETLFTTEGLEKQDKIALLIGLLGSKNLNKILCKEYLDMIGLPQFSKILARGKPKIEVNVTNQNLLTALRDSNFFSGYEIDEENLSYYKIVKR